MTRAYVRKNTPGREHDPINGLRRLRKCKSRDPLIKALFDALVASGMTDEELEIKTGVSAKNVTRWFTGERSPNLLTFTTVAQALGCKVVIDHHDRPQCDYFEEIKNA